MKDFFISYNRHDKQWAEWIAWTLEEAGYTVVIQAWDFRPGGNFVLDMQRATAECEKTIAVLSANYLRSEYTQSEWSAAFAGDPQSLKRKLIPMRVGECRPEGVLQTIVHVDLVGVTAAEAKNLVLGALRERAKPAQEPSFPGAVTLKSERTEPEPVAFPGDGKTVEPAAGSGLELQPFEFEVVTINSEGKPIQLEKRIASSFQEDLGHRSYLEMVSIPGGAFVMGALVGEKDRDASEGPQRQVRLNPFFIGRYVVTQEQWVMVSGLPKVNHDLDPNCSRFKGLDRPVENVNWWQAVEFCDRLSQHTGRQYRLPSEAEWEYACRAGTRTPFHFGETLTTDLANYDGNQTTDVDSFLPNAYGLYDMHGNVLEWCADHYHNNYEGTPTDGSPWITSENSDRRVLRGGSWLSPSWRCRSAYRHDYAPDYRHNYVGFRVVCASVWTL